LPAARSGPCHSPVSGVALRCHDAQSLQRGSPGGAARPGHAGLTSPPQQPEHQGQAG
jgi:hypothetical protein